MKIRILLLLLFNAILISGYGQFKNAYASSLKLINADSTHGELNGTEYVNSDGRYRYKENGTWYYRASTASVAAATVYNGTSPTTVTVGGLSSGTDISGQSLADIIESIVAPYVDPVFTSFSVSGQATTIEVGTTLSGSKTFTWSITENSGTVDDIDIYDVTASSTLVSGTANDGSQSVTVTTKQLNSNGATQVWRGIGNNSAPAGTFNSGNVTVTARYYRFYGAASSDPSNSAEVRALPSSAFQTSAGTFDMETGDTETSFFVAAPPGWTVASAIDLDALNAPITFTSQGSISVNDAGSTARTYTLFKATTGIPYSSSHTYRITMSAL